MYFTIGGRSTMSGLYRVTYVGKESTSPPRIGDPAASELREARHNLERFYGKKHPKAVEKVWPYLSHEDRFLRFAARTVLEFQDPASWKEKALAEKNPVALTHAMIALARLDDLRSIDQSKLTVA